MITSSYNPVISGGELVPPVKSDFPELAKLSDIVFGQWTLAAGSQTPNLRFILIYNIRNEKTAPIIRRALRTYNQGLGVWPGSSFPIGTDAAKALLGSVSGAGPGFLLGQHKAQLGNKKIYHVQVFTHTSLNNQKDPILAFYIH
jgi:hypothetical protein